MFGIGLPELFIILVIALVVLGPEKLPDLARAIGKGIGEFRRAADDIKQSLNTDDELRELKDSLGQAKTEMSDIVRTGTGDLDLEGLAKSVSEGVTSELKGEALGDSTEEAGVAEPDDDEKSASEPPTDSVYPDEKGPDQAESPLEQTGDSKKDEQS